MAFFSRFRKSRAVKAEKKDPVATTQRPSRPAPPYKQQISQAKVQSSTRPISKPSTPEELSSRLAAKQTIQNFSHPLSTTLTSQEFSARLAEKQTAQKSPRSASTTLTPEEISARLAAKQTIQLIARPASTILTADDISARIAAKQTIHNPVRPNPTSVLIPDELSARLAARNQRRQTTSVLTFPSMTLRPSLQHSRSHSQLVQSKRPPWLPRNVPTPAVRRLQLEELSQQPSNRRSYATRRKSPLSNLAMVQEPDEQVSDSDDSRQTSQISSPRTSTSSRSSVNGDGSCCKCNYKNDSSLSVLNSATTKDKSETEITVTTTEAIGETPRGRRGRSSTVPAWRYSSFMADTEPIMVERVQPFRTGKSPRRSLFFHRRAISLSVH